jgi:hypothetical protein
MTKTPANRKHTPAKGQPKPGVKLLLASGGYSRLIALILT